VQTSYGRGILEIDRVEDRSPLRQVRVSVIIPVLNEALNLPHVVARLPEGIFEVIVVDGGSTDGSCDVARGLLPGVRIIDQDRCGKGNALECGFRACRGDVVVTIDADGSTDPAEIPRFVVELLLGADYAKGTRFAAGGASLDITRFRQKGNRVLCAIVNRLYGTEYTDLCYGFNAFWRHTLPALGFDFTDNSADPTAKRWGDGFEVETLLNIRAANAGLKIVEVPSIEWARIHGDSKLNAVTDGFRVLSIIRMERRFSRRTTGGCTVVAEVIELRGDAAPYCKVAHTQPCSCAHDVYA
jgi:glycosyltransferase involved in cell wall biosynthesis